MPYRMTLQVDSLLGAEATGRYIRQWSRAQQRPYEAALPEAAAEPAPQTVWWSAHESRETQYARVFLETPTGLVVQDGTGTAYIDAGSGSWTGDLSKEAAVELSFQFWMMGMSAADRARIKKFLEEAGQEVP